jgi:hypothetical protein
MEIQREVKPKFAETYDAYVFEIEDILPQPKLEVLIA